MKKLLLFILLLSNYAFAGQLQEDLTELYAINKDSYESKLDYKNSPKYLISFNIYNSKNKDDILYATQLDVSEKEPVAIKNTKVLKYVDSVYYKYKNPIQNYNIAEIGDSLIAYIKQSEESVVLTYNFKTSFLVEMAEICNDNQACIDEPLIQEKSILDKKRIKFDKKEVLMKWQQPANIVGKKQGEYILEVLIKEVK